MCSTKMRVNLRTKKVRRHRIQETGLQHRRDEGKLKDHRDWRFQRESGKRFQNVCCVSGRA